MPCRSRPPGASPASGSGRGRAVGVPVWLARWWLAWHGRPATSLGRLRSNRNCQRYGNAAVVGGLGFRKGAATTIGMRWRMY